MPTLNPVGFTITATVLSAVPGLFGPNDWALSGPRDDGFDIVVFAVPTGSAGATTSIQRRINGGSWMTVGGAVAGVYAVTGLSVETAYRVELRAVNTAGAGPISVAKGMFTRPSDPRGFRGWDPTVDLGTTGDVFIAPYGSDTTGSGAVGSPFATLTKALTVATTGQKIKARAGVYREKATISTASVKIEGYGTEKPEFTAAEPLTGFVQCSSADAAVIGATLGVDGSPVYKTTVNKTGWDYTDVNAMNIYEAGKRIYVPSDRADNVSDMFSPFDSQTFWQADAFNVNGSNQIISITDASVINSSRYTEAQLLATSIILRASPNVTVAVNITGVDFGTNTITVDGLKTRQSASASDWLYSIQNSPIALSAGTAFVVDNITDATVYLYPTSAANINLVEFSKRKTVLSLGAVAGIELRGMAIVRATGTAAGDGSNIFKSGDATRRTGYVIEHVLHGENQNPTDTARSIYLKNTDQSVIKSSSCHESTGRGIFLAPYLTAYDGRGVKNLIEKCYFDKIGGAGYLNYTQENCVFAHNYATRTGINDHSNLTNAYEGNEGVVWWGNEFGPKCYGYMTWQEATNLTLAFNCILQLSKNTTDYRAITDQNHDNITPPPSAGGYLQIFNNSIFPDPANSYAAGANIKVDASAGLSDLVATVVNNITHGCTDPSQMEVTPAQIGYNVITRVNTGNGQVAGDFDGTNVIQTNLALVYADAAGGNFSPVIGSPILSTSGQNMAATIATLAARFTQFSGWDKDYKNQTIVWANLPVGADAGLAWVR